jgi:heat shock protein HslJ
MFKKLLTILPNLVAFALILSACVARSNPASLGGTSWTLVSYGSVDKPTAATPGIHASLNFSANGQVSGNLGCNSFSGTYELKPGKLVFGPLVSTMMACPEPLMTQEDTAFQVLTGTARFTRAGNILTIYDSSGTIALTLSLVVSQ